MIVARKITKEEENCQKPVCPICNAKISAIGITKDSKIEKVTVKCKKCGALLELFTK